MGLCHSHIVYNQTNLFTAIEPLRMGGGQSHGLTGSLRRLFYGYHVSL